MKRKFDKLSADYDALSDSYDEVRRKYNSLKESSSHIEQMKYDWELMYVMLVHRSQNNWPNTQNAFPRGRFKKRRRSGLRRGFWNPCYWESRQVFRPVI